MTPRLRCTPLFLIALSLPFPLLARSPPVLGPEAFDSPYIAAHLTTTLKTSRGWINYGEPVRFTVTHTASAHLGDVPLFGTTGLFLQQAGNNPSDGRMVMTDFSCVATGPVACPEPFKLIATTLASHKAPPLKALYTATVPYWYAGGTLTLSWTQTLTLTKGACSTQGIVGVTVRAGDQVLTETQTNSADVQMVGVPLNICPPAPAPVLTRP